MYLPPIESNCNYEPFVSGDVTIADNVAIASGAIVQAGPNCRIVIASGVCIGMGAIIHAYNGTIEIEEGATVGAGVLIVGQGKIGARACIGSLTTVINCDLEAQQIIASGSILGDTSRQVSENAAPSTSTSTQNAVEPRYNTFIQPKPIAIPETPAATHTEEEATTGIDAEVETGYNTPIQPKPISIPETPVATHTEEEATIPTNVEVEAGYNTFIQPKPISIPETPAATDIEEETATSTESEFVATGNNGAIAPKPISIPEVPANTNNGAIPSEAETEATESEDEEQEEQEVQTPKPQVAGLDYVRGMMKTLFPHQNVSLSPEDEDD